MSAILTKIFLKWRLKAGEPCRGHLEATNQHNEPER